MNSKKTQRAEWNRKAMQAMKEEFNKDTEIMKKSNWNSGNGNLNKSY
jgi:hypothetical protein